ncbi:synapsin-3 [Thecamonas trahens ATCC 50062]|uniref:Synapsin-3 n=1 Tax=Thecamonas trahens ATCC 50062 TaxID=461836 RepID=A0A0L0DLG1_THETB|nr:synapsin-3 [Thecamonas trahens ATCC 50062]KNC53070.1 synapsin-3 [Thecamonas trahens ATCC 50062]|eukprot:XP_013754745.1 synapsin-3 [Thecamonas trahens ATCC 50062]
MSASFFSAADLALARESLAHAERPTSPRLHLATSHETDPGPPRPEALTPPETDGVPDTVVLVVDYTTDWSAVFSPPLFLPNGSRLVVEQASWQAMAVEAIGPESGHVEVLIQAEPESPNPQARTSPRRVTPHAVIVRNFPTDLSARGHVNALVGLAFARLPAVNSLHSVYMGMDRAMMYAQLAAIGREPGMGAGDVDPLPLVPMRYCANAKLALGLEFSPQPEIEPPAVVKVGSTHAGFGKALARDAAALDDLVSILMTQDEYYTVEPFIEHAYEYRIQWIAGHVRVFRRNSSTSWKNNRGNISFEDMDVLPHHRAWAAAVARYTWGGLDLFALDVLHIAPDRELILEINDTACGFMHEHEFEDVRRVRNALYTKLSQLVDASSESTP